jgi:hypothetical protein
MQWGGGEMRRRDFIAGFSAAASTMSMARQVLAQPLGDTPFKEDQRGDPDAQYETIEIDPSKISEIVNPGTRATFQPKSKDFGAKLIVAAAQFVGKSRAKTPEEITDMLDLFGLSFKYGNGTYVPYCAAGLSFAAAAAYANDLKISYNQFDQTSTLRELLADMEHWYFYATPSVWDMYLVQAGKHRWVDASVDPKPVPLPGWIIIYNFGKGADHCGIVEAMEGENIHTIEFNTTIRNGSETNGGVVARKTRSYNETVKGFIPIK